MKFLSAALVILMAFVVACSSNPKANVTPQATIAHYGTDVILGVTAFQSLVIQASSGPTPALSVARATPIMDKIRSVLLDAQKLSDALKLYDAATGASRASIGQQVIALLNTISTSGLSGMADGLPASIASEGAKLIGNITTTIATVKTAVAASQITTINLLLERSAA